MSTISERADAKENPLFYAVKTFAGFDEGGKDVWHYEAVFTSKTPANALKKELDNDFSREFPLVAAKVVAIHSRFAYKLINLFDYKVKGINI